MYKIVVDWFVANCLIGSTGVECIIMLFLVESL
jgi:hypothetical protein